VIKKFVFNPPIQSQPGDTFAKDGNYFNQIRNGAVVATWNLSQQPSQNLEQFDTVGHSISSLYLEIAMPGQNVSCTKVSEQANGTVNFTFSSGNGIELPNWEAAGEIADQLDAISDLPEKLLIGKAFRASPDGVNKTTQVGASVSVNLLADTPVVYTGPQ
jgi:hypothetical protein